MLEHRDEDPVGRADREEVERDRRRGDHQRPEGQQEEDGRERQDEEEHVGQPLAHLRVEVMGARGHAGDGHLHIGQRPRDRRDHRRAKCLQRVERRGIVPVSRDGEVDASHRSVGVDDHGERSEQLARRPRSLAEELVGAAHLGCVDAVRLDDEDRGCLRAREGLLDALVRPHDLEVVREIGEVRQLRVHAERREREDDEHAAGDKQRDERTAQDRCDEAAPRAVVSRAGPEERDPPELDPVSETVQEGGEHGQRPDHRREDDDHRSQADRAEERVARHEHAGHRDEHRGSGDEHGLPGRPRRLEQRLVRRTALPTLLALAPEVEQRVVDPDRHPDHQDDRAQGLLLRRDDVARQRVHAGGDEHGGEGEQDGKTRGDEGAEGDDEDRDRQRKRRQLGARQVLLEALRQLMVGGGLPELLDDEARIAGLDIVDRRQDRPDLPLGILRVALHLELDEHGVLVRETPGRRRAARPGRRCSRRSAAGTVPGRRSRPRTRTMDARTSPTPTGSARSRAPESRSCPRRGSARPAGTRRLRSPRAPSRARRPRPTRTR